MRFRRAFAFCLIAALPAMASASLPSTIYADQGLWPKLHYQITVTPRAGSDPIIAIRLVKDAPRLAARRGLTARVARAATRRAVSPVTASQTTVTGGLRIIADSRTDSRQRWIPGTPYTLYGIASMPALLPPRRPRPFSQRIGLL